MSVIESILILQLSDGYYDDKPYLVRYTAQLVAELGIEHAPTEAVEQLLSDHLKQRCMRTSQHHFMSHDDWQLRRFINDCDKIIEGEELVRAYSNRIAFGDLLLCDKCHRKLMQESGVIPRDPDWKPSQFISE